MTQAFVAQGHVTSGGTGGWSPESRVRVCVCVDIARRHGDPGFGGTKALSPLEARKGGPRVMRKGSFWESLLSYK